MASVVGICNAALIAIGADTIASLTEPSEEARMCQARYPDVRDAVLEEFPWNCARTQAELPAGSSGPQFGFSYRYALPTDPYCLRVLKAGEGGDQPWRVVGRDIETDAGPPLKIEYIARVTDPNLMDPLLREAISARMAAEIAYKLTGSRSLEEAQWQKYMAKIRQAQLFDAVEGTPDPKTGSSWLESRG